MSNRIGFKIRCVFDSQICRGFWNLCHEAAFQCLARFDGVIERFASRTEYERVSVPIHRVFVHSSPTDPKVAVFQGDFQTRWPDISCFHKHADEMEARVSFPICEEPEFIEVVDIEHPQA